MIVDSPGLEDTRGPEIDIANMYGVVRAAQSCKSIVPIILISEKSMGERMSGIKRVSKDLSSMFNNLHLHLDSFVFLFNKYINRKNAEIPVDEAEIKKIIDLLAA